MTAAANVLRWYVMKYGGTRGPVAHLVVEYESPTTICGLTLRTDAGTSLAPSRGTWGQPTRTAGPGIRLCKNCDRMKDADSMQPRPAVPFAHRSVRNVFASTPHGSIRIVSLEIEGDAEAVQAVCQSLVDAVRGRS
jgi:hypothetical protein